MGWNGEPDERGLAFCSKLCVRVMRKGGRRLGTQRAVLRVTSRGCCREDKGRVGWCAVVVRGGMGRSWQDLILRAAPPCPAADIASSSARAAVRRRKGRGKPTHPTTMPARAHTKGQQGQAKGRACHCLGRVQWVGVLPCTTHPNHLSPAGDDHAVRSDCSFTPPPPPAHATPTHHGPRNHPHPTPTTQPRPSPCCPVQDATRRATSQPKPSSILLLPNL